MVSIGRAVEVVPLLHVPLLASDEQDALSREDEEALLVRLTVIHAGRLAGPEDSDVEAELRETSSLTLTEPCEDAHLVRLAPDCIAGVARRTSRRRPPAARSPSVRAAPREPRSRQPTLLIAREASLREGRIRLLGILGRGLDTRPVTECGLVDGVAAPISVRVDPRARGDDDTGRCAGADDDVVQSPAGSETKSQARSGRSSPSTMRSASPETTRKSSWSVS